MVRHHCMFEALPPPVLARLVHVLERATYKPGELIVQHGAHGTAMFVLIAGEACAAARAEYGVVLSSEADFASGVCVCVCKSLGNTLRSAWKTLDAQRSKFGHSKVPRQSKAPTRDVRVSTK